MSDDEEYLISYANFKSNLIQKQNNFLNPNQLKSFYRNIHFGFPICVPQKIKFFDYKNAKYFTIDKKIFSKNIFGTTNLDYIGIKKFFRHGSKFAYNVKLKNKYADKLKKYVHNTKILKKKINKLKSKNRKICAMQIRNVPHYGHEAVFNHILSKFEYLYLNPIYGVKKKKIFQIYLYRKL